MTKDNDHEIISLHDLVEAVEVIIKGADPAKRGHLYRAIDAYSNDFPPDFHWAIGGQAPTILYHLMWGIINASSPEGESKTRPSWLDRKPEGNA